MSSGAVTDRSARGERAAGTPASTSARTSTTTPDAVAEPTAGLAHRAPRPARRLHGPVPRRRGRRRRRAVPDVRAELRRAGRPGRPRWPWPCSSPTACRCCWPARCRRRGRRARRPARAGRRRRAAHPRRRCATWVPATVDRRRRPVGLRPLLRGARGDARRRRRASQPVERHGVVDRHPGHRRRGRGRRPAARRAASRCAGCPAAPRERDDLYSYRRDGRTGRFAGVVARSAP